MKKNLKYLKNLFDRDGIQVPEKLSEKSIMELLKDSGQERSRETEPSYVPSSSSGIMHLKRRRTSLPIRKLAVSAACVLLAVLLIPVVYDRITVPPDTSTVNGKLYTFSNTGEIRNLLRNLNRNSSPGSYNSPFLFTEDADMAAAQTAEAPAAFESREAVTSGMSNSSSSSADTGTSGNTEDHSSTYLQVEGVDEADIVKTDGSYIYYVTRNAEVQIYSASEGKTEKLSTIGHGSVDNYIHDIYLMDDLLVTVGVVYDAGESSSAVVTYDISNRIEPEQISIFRQSGEIVSSRMVGNYVYLVTSEYVYKGGRELPMITKNGNYETMDAADICAVPEPQSPSYVTLSSVDVSAGSSMECKSKAILGASEEIYCSNKNLYTTASEYDQKKNRYSTRVVKASLNGSKVGFEATGTVDGTINDQFSMDEKEGYFRIATTTRRDGIEVNNLFVLDQNMKETGSVTGFARNESIRAVRYIGDMAYVITFEQVDPLFIIDLSDPSDPKIKGEVQIDGFSSLLVPAAENRLLGIGYLTKDNGYGGVYTDGLKLALFDISNPSHPEVLDSREFEGMHSPAQEDHRALTVNQEKKYYAIPYGEYNSRIGIITSDDVLTDAEQDPSSMSAEPVKPEYTGGVLVFGAEDSINVFDDHNLTEEKSLQRSVYIDDWIYALDEKGNVLSFQPENVTR